MHTAAQAFRLSGNAEANWLQRSESNRLCLSASGYEPDQRPVLVSAKGCEAFNSLACAPYVRAAQKWRKGGSVDLHPLRDHRFSGPCQGPPWLPFHVGGLPQIRTAYLSLRRRALCSNELGDRQMLVRVPCSAHGHPASKAGTLLTSFTLMIGDRCGERSRLTSWTVTLPHLMHKRPWCAKGDSNPQTPPSQGGGFADLPTRA